MTQFNSTSYDVQRPTGLCAFTGRAFAPGENYIATLIEDGENLQRLDVALDVWDAGQRPDNVLGYWKAVAAEPNQKKKLFVDDEVLMNLVERLADADQPQRLAFRFVLALILMRKKLLRYDRTEARSATDGEGNTVEQAWWIMTPKLDLTKGPMGKWHDQAKLEILDPALDENGIRQVTDQLSEILQAEL
jgi:hypothetical protein